MVVHLPSALDLLAQLPGKVKPDGGEAILRKGVAALPKIDEEGFASRFANQTPDVEISHPGLLCQMLEQTPENSDRLEGFIRPGQGERPKDLASSIG
jgi:hypothetical protein